MSPKRDARTAVRSAIVELAAGGARASVAPGAGGAIAGFTWRGHPVLRVTPDDALAQADAARCSAYALVPYSNRIRDASLHFAGRVHALARNHGRRAHSIHGVGWQRPWQLRHVAAHAVQLVLVHDADSAQARSAWPWSFEASQTLQLAALAGGGAQLQLTLTIASRAREPFPFGLGWHPYFRKGADTSLGFAAAGVWLNDDDLLPTRHGAIPVAWQFAPPRGLGDVVLDNVFTGWQGHAVLEQPDAGMRVTVGADRACACLVVYAPPGQPYLAVEPVTHETDAFNRAEAGASGTGLRVLAPGQAFSCTMRITVEPLA
jgi:aldose 1-epimerase